MDKPREKPNWKGRFLRVVSESRPQSGTTTSLSAMDRVVAKRPLWKRLLLPGAVLFVIAGAGVWALSGPGGSVYRVPIDQLTIGTVSKGPFEDFIAVRGSVAPM